ncbi:nuclear transport factor 2 family protein [Variovorax defluvii]|uniref:Nuclear transport factor 2 family protein n=1 Tax=Variovorax defluvii TaxID=913761 RepID=A0ABP8GWA8_9BURK
MKLSFDIAEIIRQKKAKYCRFVDTKQWKQFEALALPDARFIFYDVNGKVLHDFPSPESLLAPTARLLDGARSSHRVSNSELSLISETQVEAIWAMEDYLVFPAKNGKPATAMRGYGHYHEIWECKEDDWFLKKLELTRQIFHSYALPSEGGQGDMEGSL